MPALLGMVFQGSLRVGSPYFMGVPWLSPPTFACCQPSTSRRHTQLIPPQGLDAVLSDMCHWTHGNSVVDAYKSLELARCAWTVATGGEAAEAADPNLPFSRGVLKPGGSLVMKLLQVGAVSAVRPILMLCAAGQPGYLICSIPEPCLQEPAINLTPPYCWHLSECGLSMS